MGAWVSNSYPSAAALTMLLLLALMLIWRRRQRARTKRRARQSTLADAGCDTVAGWPPKAVRVLTLPERQAYSILQRALPGYLVLAQVPLSRFISVPVSQPYEEWLARAGRLSVDILVCDASSRVIAAVDVRSGQETPRQRKRHERMQRVLQAAGIPVHEWDESRLPAVTDARSLFIDPPMAESIVDSGGRRTLPVPEMLELSQEQDESAQAFAQTRAHEPVSSGYFDDLQAMRQPA